LRKTVGIWREQKEAIDSLSIVTGQAPVTVSGKLSIDVPPGTLNSILKQAGLKKEGQ
jgi:hypothetical protein